MSALNRSWNNLKRFVVALDGIDDPMGTYLFSLEKRIEKLERERLEHPHSGGDTLPHHAETKSA